MTAGVLGDEYPNIDVGFSGGLMFSKPNWFVLVSTGVVAVCLVWLLADLGVDEAGDRSTDLDEAAKDTLASEAAIRQIAAESKTLDAADTHVDAGEGRTQPDAAVEAVAPPGFQPAPVAEREPTPPEGYSFSSFHQVTRSPLTDDDLEGLRKATPVPEWMAFGLDALADQAAVQGRDWTFGWVKLAAGADLGALAGTLTAQGGEVIGQAGDLVRVRLPADRNRLEAIASADAVAGIGTVPAAEKITDTLAERALANVSEEAPVWITLMDDDPDGAWRRELQNLGAVVGRFDPAVRAYTATIPLASLQPISSADYVLAVESIGRLQTTLEISTPAMGADSMRTYDDTAGLFTGVGGASVPIGVMDTGLNVDHLDIASNRRSICGANFIARADEREEDQDLWFDFNGHGTAVTGVVAGTGSTDPSRAGMAPLVQDIRFAKALSSVGYASALGWGRALDWLAKPTSCGDDIPRKPLVVNSSLGVGADIWESRSYMERKIDAAVFWDRLLFVTSVGNTDPGFPIYSSMAGAKNALAVGASQHVGDIASFSSPGPTYDGRLNPKVVGSGVAVQSPEGRGSRDGYFPLSGTSFSSPAVVGVAALVMDAVPELKEEPAALRARLMASAIKPDGFLGVSSRFALDNTRGPGSLQNRYGLGKVSARTAILNRDTEDGWVGGTTAFDVDPDNYLSHDIVVPEGASRLEVVLTWDEPPSDTIANAVLHDLDLWVDRQASCQSIAACGEFRSVSPIDNVEWVIVPNPPPGVYRMKVTPNRVVGTPPRAGLAWTVIRGDSTPRLSVSADVERIDVDPDEPFEVEVTMTTDAYVAAGAGLRVDCRAETGSNACDQLSYLGEESAARREDRVERSLEGATYQIDVGEVGPDEQQVVTLKFPGQPAGRFQIYLAASAWNANSDTTSVPVVVGDSDADSPAPIRRPPNDDYDTPTTLASGGGETTFDLVAATSDQGEPPYSAALGGHPRRYRSLWYLWTAPDDGLVRFTIVQSNLDDYSDSVVVDAFPDDPLAGLDAVGTGQLGGGTTFHAERGETYRVRLTIHPSGLIHPEEDDEGNVVLRQVSTPQLTMKWGPAAAPENDHFSHAAIIEGENGSVTGNNQAATTERGEFIGDASAFTPVFLDGWGASVWYRWTAPATGDWKFSVNRRGLAISVFTGDTASDARLMSGAPATKFPDDAVFPATEGVEYHIGIASASAYFSGTEFTLSWVPGMREDPYNDDFASAQSVLGNFAPTNAKFDMLTVEHGEPADSGVRTAWYVWEQPAPGGRHTWQVDLPGFSRPLGDAPLQMSAFKGAELAALEPVAVNVGENTDLRMAFDTEEGESYAFALGLPRDAAHTSVDPVEMVLQWGKTPANDDLANAIALMGVSGSVTGSNEFATNEPGERAGALGDSSLWWTFEPAESGWMRFVVAGSEGIKLAIYRTGADGNLELAHTSRSLAGGEVAVNFEAEAGVRYVIRLGSYIYDRSGFGGRERGPFELSWGPGSPPALLRFVEVIPDNQPGAGGAEMQFDGLGAQAFNADGTELYVASESGIVVFARDANTGELTLVQILTEFPLEDPDIQLLWDETGSALLVASCDGWARFTPVDGGGIEHAGMVEGGPCPREAVLIDGSFIHIVMPPFMIETYQFNDGHTALTSVEQVMVDGVTKAAMTADGSHLYAVTAGFAAEPLLIAFERDAESGSLGMVSTIAEGSTVGDDETIVEGLAQAQGLAVHTSHLFVSAGRGGGDTAAFDLSDPANPSFVGKRDSFVPFLSFFASCGHSLARHDVAAVDIACRASSHLYTVQVGGTRSVFPGDLLALTGFSADTFGNDLPNIDDVLSYIASPDGRHVYLAGLSQQLVFFPDFGIVESSHIVVFERRTGN